MEMLIRQANKNDARKISYLIRKNTENVLENGYNNKQVETWKKANTPLKIKERVQNDVVFCAFQRNQILGTIGLRGSLVVGLYVSYSRRGCGIGKLLLEHLEDFARSKNIISLELTSTPSAKGFYSKNGYMARESVMVNIDGVDFAETVMTKAL